MQARALAIRFPRARAQWPQQQALATQSARGSAARTLAFANGSAQGGLQALQRRALIPPLSCQPHART